MDEIHAHRHDLTHELGKYLVDPDFDPNLQLFNDASVTLARIHKFWVQIELDTGWLDDHGEITSSDLVPGPLLLLDMCIDAYLEGFVVEQEHMKQA